MNEVPMADLPLRDIRIPAEPSWWPPAPGWWVLSMLLVALLAWAVWRGRRAWLHRQRRLRIQRQLDAELTAASTPEDRLRRAAEFLRRWVLAEDASVAMLRGEAWLAYLDGKDPARPFTQGAGRLLLDGPYRRQVDPANVDTVLTLVRRRLFEQRS